jgi:hypothetical protein
VTREEAQARLEAWMNGEIPESERATVRMSLAGFLDLAAEWDLWEDMTALKVEEPSPALERRLDAMLASFQEEQARVRRTESAGIFAWIDRLWPKQPAYGAALAAACLLAGLVGGWFAGYHRAGGGDEALQAVRRELKDTRELAILAMLQQPIAGERLRAISYAESLAVPDTTVLEALTRTLRYDTSVNVRLAALDTLARHKDELVVRAALQVALRDESSPMVQMELVRVLAQIDHPEARLAIQEFLTREDVDDSVRMAVERALETEL